jgi:hypothetical protein
MEVDRNRRLILAWDRLSLALCHGDATTLDAVPAAEGDATIRVEPASDEPAAGAGTPTHAGAATPAGAPTQAGAGPSAHARDDSAVPPVTATAAFTVAPWPFSAGRVAVGCEARVLPGSFGDAAELHAALAAAPWVPLRFELRPG